MSRTSPLQGRRESVHLALPSVRRMADVLTQCCREPSWVRTSVASLDRFAALTGRRDLETLLADARKDPAVATETLAAFARALDGYTSAQIAALAIGPKLWFTLNGIGVAWRSLLGTAWPAAAMPAAGSTDRLILLALVGSGLHRAELLRLRVRDAGSLDADGRIVCDLAAHPLAVRYVDLRSKRRYVTFLSEPAREALARDLERRSAAGEVLGADSPLVAAAGGAAGTARAVARAARRNAALISAGNNVNVEMCRKTGEFFRTWGLPGARFVASDHARAEEAL